MHTKRIAMKKSWPLSRKGKKRFIIRCRGPHQLKTSLPLLVVIRDLLEMAKTKNEVKKILKEGNILVDNKTVKDEKFGIGLFDRVYFKKIEKVYTLKLTKKGSLEIKELKTEIANKKSCKIIGKKTLKGNKIQINLYDGKNFIITKKDVKIGDSAIVDLKTKKIIDYLKLDQGSHVLIIGGKHIGSSGKISKVEDKVSVVIKDKTFKIQKQNIFVVEEKEIGDLK